jgi:hypothetical protein
MMQDTTLPAEALKAPLLGLQLFENTLEPELFSEFAQVQHRENKEMRSFWMHVHNGKPLVHPATCAEQVVLALYHTRLTKVLGAQTSLVCGLEWWVHARTVGDDYLRFHFDKDEGVYESTQARVVKAPCISSVFYVTGGDKMGETVVVGARHSSEGLSPAQPAQGVTVVPRANSYLIFPGAVLHGVVPRCSESQPPHAPKRITLMINVWLGCGRLSDTSCINSACAENDLSRYGKPLLFTGSSQQRKQYPAQQVPVTVLNKEQISGKFLYLGHADNTTGN